MFHIGAASPSAAARRCSLGSQWAGFLHHDAAAAHPIGQLSELEAGYVGGFNLAAFFLGAYFSERLRNALSIRLLLSGAVWLGVLALVASAVPAGFYWLAFWRAVLGAIAGLIMVQSVAFATAAAPTDKRPVAAGYVYAGVGVVCSCPVYWRRGY